MLLILVSVSGVEAQSPTLRVGGSVGLVSQGAPAATETGVQVGLLVMKWIQPWLGFGSSLDIMRTSVDSRVSVCYRYDETDACFRRPDAESVLSAGGRLLVKVPGEGGIRPRGAVGLAWSRSISAANPGERRTFVSPEFEAGVAWGQHPQGLLVVRVRNLDRWTGVTHGQGALLVGLLW
jgi:hypothetical protein